MYLYVATDLLSAGWFEDPSLAATTERHHIDLGRPTLDPAMAGAIADGSAWSSAAGVVFEFASGLPSRVQLNAMRGARAAARPVWMYWPLEHAIECIDDERLDSVGRLVTAAKWMRRICGPVDRAVTRWDRLPTGLRWVYRGEFPVRRSDILVALEQRTLLAQPLPLASLTGVGAYLRTDYWSDAADDAHMGAVVASLAAKSQNVVCFTPRVEPLAERAGVRQVVLDRPRLDAGEDAIVLAPAHYRPIVKAACQTLAPAYLYDRLAAGQSVGAELSQTLGIPYIVEYRGAGALVREALGDRTPFYPELYAHAEELALRQATAIVVDSAAVREELVARGVDARRIALVCAGADLGSVLESFVAGLFARSRRSESIETGDAYKDQVQNQWNENPVGAQHARSSQPHTLDWFLEVEQHRYQTYAPWMPHVMEFAQHRGKHVLEIGGGIGTDLAQFALNGAIVTDIDLAAGHLKLAEENFRLRGLTGRFIHHDAESLPFDDASFDVVYSNGVLHHTPNTVAVVREIHRVLRPGGRAIVMLYAEDSLHYWRKLVWQAGIKDGLLDQMSIGEIMSRQVERTANEARPLVKVYTNRRAAALFKDFEHVQIVQRQLEPYELPDGLQWTLRFSESTLGWNLIIKADKPR